MGVFGMINGGRGPTYHNTAYHIHGEQSRQPAAAAGSRERGREKRETRETRQEKNAKNREIILIILLIGVNVREVMMRLV